MPTTVGGMTNSDPELSLKYEGRFAALISVVHRLMVRTGPSLPQFPLTWPGVSSRWYLRGNTQPYRAVRRPHLEWKAS